MPVIQIHRAKNGLKVRKIGSRERMSKKDYRRRLKTIPSPLQRISNRTAWNPSSRLQHTICLGKREDIPIIQIAGTVDSENTFIVKRAVDIDKSGIPKPLFKPPIWRRIALQRTKRDGIVGYHVTGNLQWLNQSPPHGSPGVQLVEQKS